MTILGKATGGQAKLMNYLFPFLSGDLFFIDAWGKRLTCGSTLFDCHDHLNVSALMAFPILDRFSGRPIDGNAME